MTAVAFIAPVKAGKAEAWRRFCQALGASRRDEFAASRQRLGIVAEYAWIAPTPRDEIAIVCIEAPDPERVIAALVASSAPFDCWFRAQLRELCGLDLAAAHPSQPHAALFTWKAPTGTGRGERREEIGL